MLNNLSACLVAHLLSQSANSDRVSYFFGRYDDPEPLTARTMIGSIARQLLSDLPLEVFATLDQDNRMTKPDLESIFEILASRLSDDYQYFIILDGLNEFEDAETEEVAQFLKRLLALTTLKIKISYSDQVIRTRGPLLKGSFAWHIAINQTNITFDINYYIDVTLEQKLENETLQLGDPGLILRIREALKEGAKAVFVSQSPDEVSQYLLSTRFLWVIFQIESICAQQTDEQIIEAIQDLPKDLSRTYERILQRLAVTQDVKFASRIIKWLAVAKRPLTLEELREAIAVDPSQKELIAARLVNNIVHALSCCGPLVVIDEEQGTVHFTHPSIRHYLILDPIDPSLTGYHIDLKAAETSAGVVCVTYLNFDVFDRRLTKAPIKGRNTADIPREIIRAMLPRTTVINKLTAMKLLKDKEYLNSAIQRQFEKTPGIVQQHFFFPYAKKFWLLHTKELQPTSKTIWAMWCRMLTDENFNVDMPWLGQNQSADDILEVMSDWAALNDHEAIFTYIAMSDGFFYDQKLSTITEDQRIESIATTLAKYRRQTALRMFLELQPRSGDRKQERLRTKLLIPAAWYDWSDIVKMCLIDGANAHKPYKSANLSEFNIIMKSPSDKLDELLISYSCVDALRSWQ